MEEMNRQRSEAEAKKAAYQEWLQKNELDSTGDAAYDGITVTDMGVSRTQAWVRTLDDGPDPPNGRSSSKHDGRVSNQPQSRGCILLTHRARACVRSSA